MEIPTTRKRFDVREHCEYVEHDGGWTITFPLIDVSASGPTKDEAFQALVAIADQRINADPELQQRFIAFRDQHAVEVPVPEEEQREMRTLLERSREASKHFTALTADDMDAAIASATPTLVDFWADWCIPCHALAPVLKEVADDLGERIVVSKINTDENRSVVERFGVEGFPTMILFKEGAEVHRVVGAGRSKEQLLGELTPYL